jgi:predicted porin
MDAGYQSLKYFGQSTSLFAQNGASTSAIKFTATEDLGAGMKAGFMYEIDPLLISGNGNTTLTTSPVGTATLVTASTGKDATTQNNNATQQAGLTGKGEQYVMISSASLGTIKMGTPNTATLDAFGVGSPFGTAVGSGYGSTGTIFADKTRIESTAKYESPSFDGFQVTYVLGPKNDTPYGTVSSTGGQTIYARRVAVSELGLHYVQGPLTIRGAILSEGAGPYASTSATKNNVTTKTTTLGANYDLGFMKGHGN